MLHLIHPDGTDLTTIPEPGCAFSPAWSPDGNWIVFDLNNEPSGPDLFVSRPDGTDLIQLTHTPNVKEVVPNWGP